MAGSDGQSPRLIGDTDGSNEGQAFTIGPSGLTLALRLPDDSTDQQQLLDVNFKIYGADEETELVADTGFASSAGADLLPQTAEWISVDWSVRRYVTEVNVQVKTDVPNDSPTSPTSGRLMVTEGGGWFPPTPSDIIMLNEATRLASVPATSLMVELGGPETGSGEPPRFKSSEGNITEFSILADPVPHDLTVALGDDAPFFEHRGPVPQGEKNPIEITGLADAVNRYRDANEYPSEIPIVFRAARAGEIVIHPEFNATVATVKRTLDGLQVGERVTMPWDEEVSGTVLMGEGSVLRKANFAIDWHPVRQRAHLAPSMIGEGEGEGERSPRVAHLCDPSHAAAQQFHPLPDDAVLIGLDLFIRPTSRRLAAMLTLYPDEIGRPQSAPFGDASVEWQWEADADPPYAPRWVTFDLPKPVMLKQPWWAVLTVDTGEALWYLSAAPPEGVGGAVYRLGRGAWSRREVRGSSQLWGMSRVRVADSAPPAPLTVRLRRGGVEMEASRDEDGRVVLDESALAALNAPNGDDGGPLAAAELEIVFRADTAGEITVRELEVLFSEARGIAVHDT